MDVCMYLVSIKILILYDSILVVTAKTLSQHQNGRNQLVPSPPGIPAGAGPAAAPVPAPPGIPAGAAAAAAATAAQAPPCIPAGAGAAAAPVLAPSGIPAAAPSTQVCHFQTLTDSPCALSTETERHIIANNPKLNARFNYAKNYIKTSKYTLLNFLPYTLFEQFQRLANLYFLCLLVLQLIPVISSLSPITTAIPLIGALVVTGAKDAYDDFQRHQSDKQDNKRKSSVLRNGQLVEEFWSEVLVGDVIRMENNQFVPADILLLSTSEPNGQCYIETSELDGSYAVFILALLTLDRGTNLKCKQCLPETQELGQDDGRIGTFQGEVECELPNNQLNKFVGTLHMNNNALPLDNDKILLRGHILRNTQWCYGIVIFAGRDTKLMMNSFKTKFKRTSIDRLLTILDIFGIVFFQLPMCLFCTVACGIWEIQIGQYSTAYLPWDSLIPAGGATVITLLVFFSYAIVLNTVVPIFLVEVMRLGQSFFINWDEDMRYNGVHAKARNTTLIEELGQIEYIFSDKTGTLTQNIMAFSKCSIASRRYGDAIDPGTGEPIEITEVRNG
ncbi:hypothetical protein Pcinc_008044 [Petrolisthes cinctipes]|uniref:P-type ATPase N-terminal domain-containing protein n=1 Tax=Petrolisthes cinctipes TaxID=88211 RepID=A0AAE1G7F7_PETCI|nr:hypothetical protein Pcinc_008044 [Petrolisthes cinctipes]